MDRKHNKGRHNDTERKAKRISIDHQAQRRLAFDSFCVANFHCIVHQGETSHSKSAPFSASIVLLVASAYTVGNETAYSNPLDGNKSFERDCPSGSDGSSSSQYWFTTISTSVATTVLNSVENWINFIE